LKYQDLLAYLNISTIRELEDLIIDAIYQGILTGKLDQQKQELQVDTTMGRDLRPGQLDDMIKRMASWSDRTNTAIQVMDRQIQHVMEYVNTNEANKIQYNQAVEQVRNRIYSKNKQIMTDSTMEPSSSMLSPSSSNNTTHRMPPRQDDFYEAERTSGRAKKRQVMGR
jgi:COP9 signalosome complex subunit 7